MEILEENKALKIASQFLEIELGKNFEERSKVENFLPYRIYRVFADNLSFKKMFRIPYELFKLSKKNKSCLFRVAYVAWYSDLLIKLGESKRGLLFAKKYLYGKYRKAYYLLEANVYIEDENRWLKNINSYLSKLDAAPISLSDERQKERFLRIQCKIDYKINQEVLVTIIMPAYNAQNTVEFAIDSILKQTYQNFELIIIDDCSTDNTGEIIKRKAKEDNRIKIICNQQNLGPYVSKNKALDISNGEYITGHDADDWAHPQRIEKQINFMLKNRNIKALVAKKIRMTEDGEFVNFYISKNLKDDGVLSLAFISCMIERDFMRKKIGYWDSVKFGADSEIMNRIKSLDESVYVEENIFTMFCLESATSLTNHPEFGISKVTGMSAVRRKYFDSFKQWHANLQENFYLEFPLK
ncbi:hypothetical protein B6S12_10565, partial [Helicobacter valdiviensis]